jgi:hypothetical protein
MSTLNRLHELVHRNRLLVELQLDPFDFGNWLFCRFRNMYPREYGAIVFYLMKEKSEVPISVQIALDSFLADSDGIVIGDNDPSYLIQADLDECMEYPYAHPKLTQYNVLSA